MENRGGGYRRYHAWWRVVHTSKLVQHTLVSEINSRARMGHAPLRGSRMEMGLEADGSSEAEEQSGEELQKIDKFKFEKSKSKSFKEVADPRM